MDYRIDWDLYHEVAKFGARDMKICMQCGTCTSVCPWNLIDEYRPRQILRQLSLGTGTEESIDQAVWSCITCAACDVNCPHGIEIIDVIKAVCRLNVPGGLIPASLEAPLASLRSNGIYDAPRRVLESISGLTVVEMTNNRENSLCCGGVGAWCDNPRSQGLGVLRVEETLNTGAEVIVTACPYCSRMLNAAVEELDVSNQIAVQDLAEILLQSVMMRVEAHIVEPATLESDMEVCHA
jgi:Fe-S oxidoreductase